MFLVEHLLCSKLDSTIFLSDSDFNEVYVTQLQLEQVFRVRSVSHWCAAVSHQLGELLVPMAVSCGCAS